MRILALDIGTSSVRSALFDLTGRRVASTLAQQAYRVRHGADGTAELDPTEIKRAAWRCLRRSAESHEPVAVGVSCFWHGLMGLNANKEPITPIYTWADSRCREAARELRARLSEKRIHARTGCMLRTPFWPAKLVWLRQTNPALFRRVHHWSSVGEWLQLQLTGETSVSYSMASATGLFSPSRLDWDDELLEVCRISREQLNVVSDEPGNWRGALWFPAIGDGAAGNLGSDATVHDVAAINYGTSAAVRVMQTGQVARAPFGLFAYRVDARRYVVGGAISNAGNLRAWCERELRWDGSAGKVAHGLTVNPLWVAERAPDWVEEPGGFIGGITMATTAADIARAIREATFRQLGRIIEQLPGKLRFVVSGGLSRNGADMQLLADVLGRPVSACAEPEASLRGAAVFALEKLGAKLKPLPSGKTYRPQGRSVAPIK